MAQDATGNFTNRQLQSHGNSSPLFMEDPSLDQKRVCLIAMFSDARTVVCIYYYTTTNLYNYYSVQFTVVYEFIRCMQSTDSLIYSSRVSCTLYSVHCMSCILVCRSGQATLLLLVLCIRKLESSRIQLVRSRSVDKTRNSELSPRKRVATYLIIVVSYHRQMSKPEWPTICIILGLRCRL